MFENVYDMKCEKTADGTYGCKLYKSPQYSTKTRPHNQIMSIKKISVSSDHKTVIEGDKIFFKNQFKNIMNCATMRRSDGKLNLMCQAGEGRPEVLITG